MPKFSVKKPLTVFVAVIAILVLGVVAYTRMTPDLLPNMDFPYVMIMTTYPGASPEKVEEEITKPMEQAMSTLEHIQQVSSTSSENASMVMLEFAEAVNMDTIGVDIQQKISALQAGWEDTVGAPYVLKINPSMLPVEVAAVSMEGMDTIALTEFLDQTLMNKLEGISGVARVSATGKIEKELHVILDQKMIDEVNRKVASAINGELDEAEQELTEQKEDLEKAQNQMKGAQSQINSSTQALAEQTAKGEAELTQKQQELQMGKAALQAQILVAQTAVDQLEQAIETLEKLDNKILQLNTRKAQLEKKISVLEPYLATPEGQQSYLTLSTAYQEAEAKRTIAKAELDAKQASYDQAKAAYDAAVAIGDEQLAEYEKALEEAEKNLNDANASYQTVLTVWEPANAAMENRKRVCADAGVAVDANLKTELGAASTELIKVETDLTTVKTEMKLVGIDDPTQLPERIAQIQQQLDTAQQTLMELQTNLDGLESGEIQLQQAMTALQQAKTSGMVQISTAAGKLAASSASIDMALTQVESGLETIADSREEALRQTDLNNILTMDMVQQILTAQNFAMPAGYVEEDGVSYMVSIGDEITELDTLKNLLLLDLDMEGVEPICLKDVAQVILTDNRNETYAKLNRQDSVMLSFEKQSTYATAETTNNIQARFRQLEQEYPGLSFVALMNQGDYIYLIVDSIISSLLLGAVFAILILYLFLKDLRPTFITLCSIPISVIFAIVLMYFAGVTINMISLSGLAVAVGMLVDNSVVVIENIYRLRAKGANGIQAAVSGAGQVAGAVTASTLTTVCVFLPIVFVEGITRQLFTDLALTMSFALLASLIVALTLVPAMASGMLRKDKPIKEGFLEKKLLPLYEKSVNWSLKHKLLVLLGCVAILAASGAAVLARGFIFMPEMDMPNVNVTITMPEGSDMESAAATADQVLERMAQVEGIATAGAMMNVGTGSVGGVAQTSYTVTVYITLADEAASGAAVGKEIEQLCADLPCTVTASSAMMDMSMLTGSGISVNLYAEDMDSLQQGAKEVAQVFAGLEGVGEISDGLEEAAPALHVNVNRNAAMAQGLTVAQIYMELAQGLTDQGTVASLSLEGITTKVIVEKPEGAVLDAQELRDYVFEVTDKEGNIQQIPLSDIATVEPTTSLSSIARMGQRRYLTVTAQAQPGYNITLLTSAAQEALAGTTLPEGVSYVFAGENETILEAMEQLMLMLILGVILVYLVMVAQFQSLKSPFIVMFTIPLAFTGGFLALLICGMELSVISLIGFVMLTGIIVNNGIVLVDYINQLRLEGKERRQAIVEAGVTRMRPILMTTITTVLGLADMAVRKTAGTSLMQPVAVVCIGGLVYATLMTLYVVPCIYDLLNRKQLRQIREEDLEIVDL